MIYIKIKTASDVLNICDIIVLVWSIQDYHDIFVLIRNLWNLLNFQTRFRLKLLFLRP